MDKNGVVEVSNDGEKVLIRIGAASRFARVTPGEARAIADMLNKEVQELATLNFLLASAEHERVRKDDSNVQE